MQRYIDILKSARFQQALAVFVLQALNHYGIIDAYIANSLSGLLGVSITIGTVDRTTDRLAGSK